MVRISFQSFFKWEGNLVVEDMISPTNLFHRNSSTLFTAKYYTCLFSFFLWIIYFTLAWLLKFIPQIFFSITSYLKMYSQYFKEIYNKYYYEFTFIWSCVIISMSKFVSNPSYFLFARSATDLLTTVILNQRVIVFEH